MRRVNITLDRFREILDELIDELPEDLFRELNGGILLQEIKKVHPESMGDNLYIMGEYHNSRAMGRTITIYYGSFMRAYGHFSEDRLKARLRKTLRHEFRHHLESLAGEDDLEVEDAIQMIKYKRRNITGKDDSGGDIK